MVMNERSAFGFGDTTFTKVFVGGLAWETESETMKSYFEQFGEIHEAVVITDRSTGKSKGYGFVTFKDPESARKACENPYPVLDGRRANCNLAYLGAHKNRPSFHVPGMEKIRPPPPKPMAASTVHSSSKYFRPPVPQYAVSYSAYGYPAYSQPINPMNYYNAYGGQQFSSYYNSSGASRFPGVYLNYYPFYAQNEQSSPTHNPKMVHFPYMPHQSLQLTTAGPPTASVTVPGKVPGTTSEQNPPA